MESHPNQQTSCRSIFKDGRSVTDANAYTAAWITLINQAERNKAGGTGAINDKTFVI